MVKKPDLLTSMRTYKRTFSTLLIKLKYKGSVRDKVAKQIGISGTKYAKIRTVRDKAPKKIKKQWQMAYKISTIQKVRLSAVGDFLRGLLFLRTWMIRYRHRQHKRTIPKCLIALQKLKCPGGA